MKTNILGFSPLGDFFSVMHFNPTLEIDKVVNLFPLFFRENIKPAASATQCV